MNILFLSRRFYPEIGGVEKHVQKTSELLIKKGHKVTVITESSGKEDNYKGIKILRIKSGESWLKKFQIWKWMWKNRQIIKDSDIIHAHDVYYWYFPFRFIYPQKKSFVTFHGYETYPIRKRAIIMRKMSEKLSNGNIIVGDFIKKWYGTKPNFVIYGAADIPKKSGTAKNIQSAVFMGRLDEHTGVLEYAKAVDLIKQKYPKFEFKIFGDGEYRNKLKKFNPKGFIENPEGEYGKYHFAFSSRYLSILEALAHKRIVIAYYDNPIKEDYLKMAPFSKFIIIENSSEKIADKVSIILRENKDMEKFVNSGYDWVRNQTWENALSVYFKLWEN